MYKITYVHTAAINIVHVHKVLGGMMLNIIGSFQFDFFLIALCGSWLLGWQHLIEKVFHLTMGIGADLDDEKSEIFSVKSL